MSDDLDDCLGCLATPGDPHGEDCDHAACPDCGAQLLFHDCEHWPERADGPGRPAIWHGINPQAARSVTRTLHPVTGKVVRRTVNPCRRCT